MRHGRLRRAIIGKLSSRCVGRAISLTGTPSPDATDESLPLFHRQHFLLVLLTRLEPGQRTRGRNSFAAPVTFVHVPPTTRQE